MQSRVHINLIRSPEFGGGKSEFDMISIGGLIIVGLF